MYNGTVQANDVYSITTQTIKNIDNVGPEFKQYNEKYDMEAILDKKRPNITLKIKNIKDQGTKLVKTDKFSGLDRVEWHAIKLTKDGKIDKDLEETTVIELSAKEKEDEKYNYKSNSTGTNETVKLLSHEFSNLSIGIYQVYAKIYDKAGNCTLVDYSEDKKNIVTIGEIPKIEDKDIEYYAGDKKINLDDWTNESVTIKINNNVYSIEYKESTSKEWKTNNGNKVIKTVNGAIELRYTDGKNVGESKKITITNIDKEPPQASLNVNTQTAYDNTNTAVEISNISSNKFSLNLKIKDTDSHLSHVVWKYSTHSMKSNLEELYKRYLRTNENLRQLKKLHDEGSINDEEFEKRKIEMIKDSAIDDNINQLQRQLDDNIDQLDQLLREGNINNKEFETRKEEKIKEFETRKQEITKEITNNITNITKNMEGVREEIDNSVKGQSSFEIENKEFLVSSGTWYVLAEVWDIAGNMVETREIELALNNIPKPNNNLIDPSTWTKGPVTVSIPEINGYTIQYKEFKGNFSGENLAAEPDSSWKTYDKPFKVYENETIVYRYKDASKVGDWNVQEIKNIDREIPTIRTFADSLKGEVQLKVIQKNEKSFKLRVSANDSISGISSVKFYCKKEGQDIYDECNFDNIIPMEIYEAQLEESAELNNAGNTRVASYQISQFKYKNESGEEKVHHFSAQNTYAVYAEVIDRAGNVAETEVIEKIKLREMPKLKNETIKITPDTWSNTPIERTVTLENRNEDENLTLEYQVVELSGKVGGETNWNKYPNGGIKITENSTIFFRYRDNVFAGSSSSRDMIRVDTNPPKIKTGCISNITDNSYDVKISVSDSNIVGQEENKKETSSGISKIEWYKKEGNKYNLVRTSNYTNKIEDTFTYTDTTTYNENEFKVIVYDVAENKSEYIINRIGVKKPSIKAEDRELTFNREDQEPTILNVNDRYVELVKSESTTKARNVGTYSITWKLKDPSRFKWEDGTEGNVTRKWTINKLTLTKPKLSGSLTKEYTGSSQSITVEKFDSNYMNQDGLTEATNAGTYPITWSLKEKDNTQWVEDVEEGEEKDPPTTEDKKVTWKIVESLVLFENGNFADGVRYKKDNGVNIDSEGIIHLISSDNLKKFELTTNVNKDGYTKVYAKVKYEYTKKQPYWAAFGVVDANWTPSTEERDQYKRRRVLLNYLSLSDNEKKSITKFTTKSVSYKNESGNLHIVFNSRYTNLSIQRIWITKE